MQSLELVPPKKSTGEELSAIEESNLAALLSQNRKRWRSGCPGAGAFRAGSDSDWVVPGPVRSRAHDNPVAIAPGSDHTSAELCASPIASGRGILLASPSSAPVAQVDRASAS